MEFVVGSHPCSERNDSSKGQKNITNAQTIFLYKSEELKKNWPIVLRCNSIVIVNKTLPIEYSSALHETSTVDIVFRFLLIKYDFFFFSFFGSS